jgi:hypothetical protein
MIVVGVLWMSFGIFFVRILIDFVNNTFGGSALVDSILLHPTTNYKNSQSNKTTLSWIGQ